MAPLIIGATAAAGTSLTLPSFATGDLILIWAYRDGTAVLPTKPTASGTVPAWVDIDAAAGANLNSGYAGYFVSTAGNETSGTWTNATGMAAITLRGQNATPIGDHVQGGSATTSGGNLTSTALTSPILDGSSVFVYFLGWRTVTAWTTPPAGYTQQAQVATETEVATKDVTTTEGSVAFSGTASAIGGYRVESIEVLAVPAGVSIVPPLILMPPISPSLYRSSGT